MLASPTRVLPARAAEPVVSLRLPAARHRRALIALRITIPVAALVIGGFPTMIGVLLLQELGLWLARRSSDWQPLAEWLYFGTYALRCALAYGLYTVSTLRTGSGGVFQDDFTYDLVGQWVVRIARGEGLSIFQGHQHVLDSLFLHVVALTYAVFGHAPLVVLTFNAVLAGLCAVLLLEIGRHMFGRGAGLAAGIGGALLPTLVLWSVVMLKEMSVLFGILLSLRCLQVLSDPAVSLRRSGTTAVLFVGGLVLVDDLRQASFLALAAVVPIALTGRYLRRVRWQHLAVAMALLAVLGASALLAARTVAPSSTLARLTRPEMLARTLSYRRATEAQTARSSVAGSPDTLIQEALLIPGYREPTFDPVIDVVEPLAFALLAPAPWQARSTRELLAAGEMLVVYALLVGVLLSPLARPRLPAFALALALYAGATWLMLAFAEGNLGNLLRHRMMLAPTTLVLGTGGLMWLSQWITPRVRRAR